MCPIRNSCERNDCSCPIDNPWDPPVPVVASGQDRSDGKCHGTVAGRETAGIAAQGIRVLEPSMCKIAVGRNITGMESTEDGLQSVVSNQRITESFRGE